MSDLAKLYERNRAIAESFDKGHLSIKPNLSTVILTCADARVDPAHFAGVELGDALMLRTVGGRVTDAVATEMAILWMLMSMASGGTPSIELAIIHHTECGMARFADPAVAAKVSAAFGSDDVVRTYAITSPNESLAADVARLRANPMVPRELTVSGHVYDIKTGRLTEVIPPAPLG